MAKCRKCPQEIMWVVNEQTNRSMPLNAQPHPKGNVELVIGDDNVRRGRVYGVGKLLDEKRAAGVQLYLNHFADCPAAQSFRKGDKS